MEQSHKDYLRIWVVLVKCHCCFQGIPLFHFVCCTNPVAGHTGGVCSDGSCLWAVGRGFSALGAIPDCAGLQTPPEDLLTGSVSCQELPEQGINYPFLCILGSD